MSLKAKKAVGNKWLTKPVLYLAIIVLLGGIFRFYNLDWDFQHSFHPDERNILGQTAGIQPGNGYRVQFFAYGQLPVYLYRFTGELVSTPDFMLSIFHGNELIAQWANWLLLAILSALLLYLLTRENLALLPFSVSTFLLLALLIGKLYPVFNLWFDVLDGVPLKIGCLLFVAVASFGISAYLADLLEMEWIGLPLYISSGAFFMLGVLPSLFSDAFAKAVGALAFTIVVISVTVWWAWVSKWGRVLLGMLAFWSFWAAFSHGGRQYVGYGETMLIGRWWAALFSTVTIGAIYLFVHKAYRNQLMALLAAASFAFAVVSIEQAHYCITESFITLMMVVIAYLAFLVAETGEWKNYLLIGAAFGLAMAAKTSSLYYIFIIIAGHLVFLAKTPYQEWLKIDKKSKDNQGIYGGLAGLFLGGLFGSFVLVAIKLNGVVHDLFNQQNLIANVIWIALCIILGVIGGTLTLWGISEFRVLRAQMPAWLKLAAVVGLAFFVFCLLSPWSLLDFSGFTNSMNYEWHVVSIADACYVIQFKDTLRYIFQLSNLISVELWWPLGITAVLGMVWVLGRFFYKLINLKKSGYLLPAPFSTTKGFALSLPDLLIVIWFLPYFGFIGAWNTKFIRYMVPLIPAFCIFAAELMTQLIEWAKSTMILNKIIKPILIVLILGSSLFYSLAYMHVYRYLHPWIESSIWIFKNVPQGSMILKEAWDDGLPTGVDHSIDPRVEGSKGPQNYRQKDITIYEMHGFNTDDTPIKKNYYADILQEGDYISIASKKLWYTLTACSPEFKPNGYNVYPVTSRYYRLLWSGLLGYKMVGEFHNFPGIFGWEHPDDMAEESFSVYDHPRVYIFKKVEVVPRDRILKLLSSDDYVKGINRDLMRTITPQNVDAFIAQRHEYLEKNGLLQKLDDETPIVPIQLPARKSTRRREESKVIAQPTPAQNDITITPPSTVPLKIDPKTVSALDALAQKPVTETDVPQVSSNPEDSFFYQMFAWLAWLSFLVILGWVALPITLKVMPSIPSGAYSLSKILGLLIFSWMVWIAGFEIKGFVLARFTAVTCWGIFFLFLVASLLLGLKNKARLKSIFVQNKANWLTQEIVFVGAFLVFTLVRIYCPHIHDPVGEGYNGGGEAGMDFGFLASVVRGETFPPQNMWMAGVPIGYSFYFGHLMMGIVTKTLGLVPAITYNLALITLFAAIFSCAFGLAFALSDRISSGLIAGFLCAAAGNLGGAKQYLDVFHQCLITGSLGPLFGHVFDYWGPTRIIPNSINEFPYFSVLYGDMHAHTLAMPFAMVAIGLVASFYMAPVSKPFQWNNDWTTLLFLGFLIGSIAFLNTWELPTWVILFVLALLVRNLSTLNAVVLKKATGPFVGVFLFSLVLLGWWGIVTKGNLDEQALGGGTLTLGIFLGLGIIFGFGILFIQKTTRVVTKHAVSLGLTVLAVLVTGVILWMPYFVGFAPQQNEILWVPERLRTHFIDFYTIYGLFMSVLVFAFVPFCVKTIQKWIGETGRKNEDLIERVLSFFDNVLDMKSPVWSMLFLGLVSLVAMFAASWVHWADTDATRWIHQLLATLVFLSLFGAFYFKKRFELWGLSGFLLIIWASLIVLRVLPLKEEATVTLGLGLFSVLWLAAFYYLGLSIMSRSDRGLSFAYLMTTLMFFIVAGLEVFVMHEYLGGDYMRNNSLFKFGINAWTLASIATGVFAPKIYSILKAFLKINVKESPAAKTWILSVAGVLTFLLLWFVLQSFASSLDNAIVHLMNVVLLSGLIGLMWLEGRFSSEAKYVLSGLGSLLILSPLLALLPVGGFGGFFSVLQRWGADFSAGTLTPLVLACLIIVGAVFYLEKKKNAARQVFYQTWTIVLCLLLCMVSIYPIFATVRKCHGFFGYFQKQWIGYEESPTLNGLAYLPRANPYDAAAINFMNRSIPGQPCLLEFVGEGYNSWGSRFSIFTGIPALMGWDGHVKEWVGSTMNSDIENRFQTTEQIFRTTDPVLAKKYLDAYGVRLVMVGTVERNGVPGRKGGYPPAGLDKFASFLPLIYKNPQVEIYYNPPAIKN